MRLRAFTALETLIAVLIIGLLLALIILTINPRKQLAEVRNSRRIADSEIILNAINQYIIDNKVAPLGIDGQLRILGSAVSGCDIKCPNDALAEIGDPHCLDLKPYLIPKYLVSIPIDPLLGTSEITYYAVKKTINNRIAVYSCGSESNQNLIMSQ